MKRLFLLSALLFASITSASAQTNPTNTREPVEIADGGTAGTTASEARANLGVAGITDSNNTEVTIVNTAARTSLCSLTVPANGIGANGALHLRVHGTYLNTSSGGDFDVDVEWGGVQELTMNYPGISTNANRRFFLLIASISNKNATNSQFLSGITELTNAAAESTSIQLGGVQDMKFSYATAAIDTTTSTVVEVFVTHSIANAGTDVIKHSCVLEGA